MKKLLCCAFGLLLANSGLRAAPVFADDFNSYSSGALVGQGGWTQTGTSTVNPIQTGSGNVPLMNTGQDAYSALPGGPITIADGDNFYIGVNLNVSAAQATGDYFLHYAPTVGETSLFLDRLYVRSSGAGFQLGWLATGGTGATVTYGTGVLDFNTDYRVVLAYHAIAGTLNDTSAIYVNPFTDPNVELNNTAYGTSAWNSPNAENLTVAEINLRQGTGTSAPTLTLDNLNASQNFADVSVFTPIPEPSSAILVMLGFVGCAFVRRKQ